MHEATAGAWLNTVYVGTTPVVVKTAPNAAAGGCGQLNQGVAYTFTTPCSGARGLNGTQALDVDTTTLEDGSRTVRLVVRDAAGNEEDSDLAVKVDNAAPAAPAVVADGAWSAAADATWTWEVASETDRAPIVGIDVERCLLGGSCEVEALPGAAFGAPITYTRALGEGETTVRVRHRDQAGNVGNWSVPRVARRDGSAPSVSLSVARTEVAPGETVEPTVTSSDALSGVTVVEKQVRRSGGDWESLNGPVSGSDGATFVFRARATDAAGNLSAWVESPGVKVVAPALVTPFPTPAPTAGPTPPAVIRKTVRLVRLTARLASGRIVVTGRLAPTSATGKVQFRVGKKVLRARVRGGRFVLRSRVSRVSRTLTLRYLGDSLHAPAARAVRVTRR